MQKLLEKKRKNNKKKKRKGEVEGRERPSASLRLRPTRASWPNRPAHTPLGRRSPPSPVQPTEGARPRVAAGPPRRRREGIRPPRRLGPLASHLPTCPLSLSLLSPTRSLRPSSPPDPRPKHSRHRPPLLSRPPAAPRPLTLTVRSAVVLSIDRWPQLELGSTEAPDPFRPRLRSSPPFFVSGAVSAATKPPRATVRAAR